MDKFYRLPQNIMLRTDVKPSSKLVYMAIVDRIGNNGKSWPGVRRISRDCGLGRNTVIRAVEELSQLGLLCIEHQITGKSNHYTVPKMGALSDSDRAQIGCAQNGAGPKMGPPPCPNWDQRCAQNGAITIPIEPDPTTIPTIQDVVVGDVVCVETSKKALKRPKVESGGIQVPAKPGSLNQGQGTAQTCEPTSNPGDMGEALAAAFKTIECPHDPGPAITPPPADPIATMGADIHEIALRWRGGFNLDPLVQVALADLVTKHGEATVREGIAICIEEAVKSTAYLRAVCANGAKRRTDRKLKPEKPAPYEPNLDNLRRIREQEKRGRELLGMPPLRD